MADKTRAERIEEAARTLCEHYKTNRHYGPTWCVRDLREALALPPDPPGDGWDALRELRDWIADEANGRGFTVDTVFNRIDRLLAAAPKEPEPADPRCESCGTTGDTVRTGDEVDLCEKCAKDIAESESPAEPAQDDGYRSLDHACEILRGCVAPYSGEQAQAVAKALKQWRDKWLSAVDCIYPDERQAIAELRAKLAAAEARIHDLGEMLGREIGRVAAAEARIAMRDRAVLKLVHNSGNPVVGIGVMLLKDDAGYFEVHWARGVVEYVAPAELGKGGA